MTETLEIVRGGAPSTAGAEAPIAPLCVDLDGTLVKTDTFHEGLLRLLSKAP